MKAFIAAVFLICIVGILKLIYSSNDTLGFNRQPSSLGFKYRGQNIEEGSSEESSQSPSADLASYPPDQPVKVNTDLLVRIACQERVNNCYVNPIQKRTNSGRIFLDAAQVPLDETVVEGSDQIIFKKLVQRLKASRYIKKSVLLGLDGVYDQVTGRFNIEQSAFRFSNSFLLSQINAANSDSKDPFLLYGPSINPFAKGAVENLRKAKQEGAVLIHWVPCLMGFNPSEENKILNEFYLTLKELKLPLLVQVGKTGLTSNENSENCSIQNLLPALKMEIKVMVSEMIPMNNLNLSQGFKSLNTKGNELSDLMKQYSNLYLVMSSQPNLKQTLQWPVQWLKNYRERIYYGSNWPWLILEQGYDPAHWQFTRLPISKEWKIFIPTLDNVIDRDIAIKKSLGMDPTILLNTVDLFN